MSTKKIEQALHAASMSIPTELYDEACNELEALREAVRFIQTVDTSAQVTPSVALRAAGVNHLFDAIAQEARQ